MLRMPLCKAMYSKNGKGMFTAITEGAENSIVIPSKSSFISFQESQVSNKIFKIKNFILQEYYQNTDWFNIVAKQQ